MFDPIRSRSCCRRRAFCCAIAMLLLVMEGLCSGSVLDTEHAERPATDIALGTQMPEDHQKIEMLACMSCHRILADAKTLLRHKRQKNIYQLWKRCRK